MHTLLSRHAGLIPRHPEQWRAIRDGRMMVGLTCDVLAVFDRGKVAGHQAPHGGVVGVDVRAEEFGEHVGFLVGCRGDGEGSVGGLGGVGAIGLFEGIADGARIRDGFFHAEEVVFFGFEGAGR